MDGIFDLDAGPIGLRSTTTRLSRSIHKRNYKRFWIGYTMTVRRFPLVFAMLLSGVLTACGPTAQVEIETLREEQPQNPTAKTPMTIYAGASEREVYYKNETDRRIAIFNYETMSYNTHDVSYLEHPGQDHTEFGGAFENCTNTEFYCVSTPMEIAVPKKVEGQTQWSVGGMSCATDLPFNEDSNIIRCEVPQGTTRFFFSDSSGVEWFEFVGVPGEKYLSIASKGFFAEGSVSTLSTESHN